MTRPAERHTLSDWLALHGLDTAACRRILDAAAPDSVVAPAAHAGAVSGSSAPDPEMVWPKIAEAMRAFFPAQRDIIDDTLESTAKVIVDQRGKSRRALTLDNGPGTYPTILYSYRGRASDALVMAHEFGHAVQIRASKGNFVAPVMREVCAFIGELTLLSHAREGDMAKYRGLSHAWQKDNRKYLGLDKERLSSALSLPDQPYNHSWNYPIARYLATQIVQRCSRDRMWTLFEGGQTVGEALQQLGLAPTAA